MARKKVSEKKADAPVIAVADPGELAQLIETELESPATVSAPTPPKRLTGQQLTDQLRQERRAKRLADRGY